MAHGNGAAGGSYAFMLDQTSVTNLTLGTPYTGTLAGSGQAVLRIEQRTDALAQTQTLQTGSGQNDRRIVAAIEFRQTRIQIAAQRLHLEMRITHAQHRFTAQAGGADHGACRQRGQ